MFLKTQDKIFPSGLIAKEYQPAEGYFDYKGINLSDGYLSEASSGSLAVPDRSQNARFGTSVAIDGDTMVVGAPYRDYKLSTKRTATITDVTYEVYNEAATARSQKNVVCLKFEDSDGNKGVDTLFDIDPVDGDIRSFQTFKITVPSDYKNKTLESGASTYTDSVGVVNVDIPQVKYANNASPSYFLKSIDSNNRIAGYEDTACILLGKFIEVITNRYGQAIRGGDFDFLIGMQIEVESSYIFEEAGGAYIYKRPKGDITSAQNSSPVLIHAPSHGLATGDLIEIEGVPGNTAANGEHYISTEGVGEDYFYIYSDRALSSPISGNGPGTTSDLYFGGSWKGAGTETWVYWKRILPEKPNGWNIDRTDNAIFPCNSGGKVYTSVSPVKRNSSHPTTGKSSDVSFVGGIAEGYRFGGSVEIKDNWIVIGETGCSENPLEHIISRSGKDRDLYFGKSRNEDIVGTKFEIRPWTLSLQEWAGKANALDIPEANNNKPWRWAQMFKYGPTHNDVSSSIWWKFGSPKHAQKNDVVNRYKYLDTLDNQVRQITERASRSPWKRSITKGWLDRVNNDTAGLAASDEDARKYHAGGWIMSSQTSLKMTDIDTWNNKNTDTYYGRGADGNRGIYFPRSLNDALQYLAREADEDPNQNGMIYRLGNWTGGTRGKPPMFQPLYNSKGEKRFPDGHPIWKEVQEGNIPVFHFDPEETAMWIWMGDVTATQFRNELIVNAVQGDLLRETGYSKVSYGDTIFWEKRNTDRIRWTDDDQRHPTGCPEVPKNEHIRDEFEFIRYDYGLRRGYKYPNTGYKVDTIIAANEEFDSLDDIPQVGEGRDTKANRLAHIQKGIHQYISHLAQYDEETGSILRNRNENTSLLPKGIDGQYLDSFDAGWQRWEETKLGNTLAHNRETIEFDNEWFVVDPEYRSSRDWEERWRYAPNFLGGMHHITSSNLEKMQSWALRHYQRYKTSGYHTPARWTIFIPFPSLHDHNHYYEFSLANIKTLGEYEGRYGKLADNMQGHNVYRRQGWQHSSDGRRKGGERNTDSKAYLWGNYQTLLWDTKLNKHRMLTAITLGTGAGYPSVHLQWGFAGAHPADRGWPRGAKYFNSRLQYIYTVSSPFTYTGSRRHPVPSNIDYEPFSEHAYRSYYKDPHTGIVKNQLIIPYNTRPNEKTNSQAGRYEIVYNTSDARDMAVRWGDMEIVDRNRERWSDNPSGYLVDGSREIHPNATILISPKTTPELTDTPLSTDRYGEFRRGQTPASRDILQTGEYYIRNYKGEDIEDDMMVSLYDYGYKKVDSLKLRRRKGYYDIHTVSSLSRSTLERYATRSDFDSLGKLHLYSLSDYATKDTGSSFVIDKPIKTIKAANMQFLDLARNHEIQSIDPSIFKTQRSVEFSDKVSVPKNSKMNFGHSVSIDTSFSPETAIKDIELGSKDIYSDRKTLEELGYTGKFSSKSVAGFFKGSRIYKIDPTEKDSLKRMRLKISSGNCIIWFSKSGVITPERLGRRYLSFGSNVSMIGPTDGEVEFHGVTFDLNEKKNVFISNVKLRLGNDKIFSGEHPYDTEHGYHVDGISKLRGIAVAPVNIVRCENVLLDSVEITDWQRAGIYLNANIRGIDISNCVIGRAIHPNDGSSDTDNPDGENMSFLRESNYHTEVNEHFLSLDIIEKQRKYKQWWNEGKINYGPKISPRDKTTLDYSVTWFRNVDEGLAYEGLTLQEHGSRRDTDKRASDKSGSPTAILIRGGSGDFERQGVSITNSLMFTCDRAVELGSNISSYVANNVFYDLALSAILFGVSDLIDDNEFKYYPSDDGSEEKTSVLNSIGEALTPMGHITHAFRDRRDAFISRTRKNYMSPVGSSGRGRVGDSGKGSPSNINATIINNYYKRGGKFDNVKRFDKYRPSKHIESIIDIPDYNSQHTSGMTPDDPSDTGEGTLGKNFGGGNLFSRQKLARIGVGTSEQTEEHVYVMDSAIHRAFIEDAERLPRLRTGAKIYVENISHLYRQNAALGGVANPWDDKKGGLESWTLEGCEEHVSGTDHTGADFKKLGGQFFYVREQTYGTGKDYLGSSEKVSIVTGKGNDAWGESILDEKATNGVSGRSHPLEAPTSISPPDGKNSVWGRGGKNQISLNIGNGINGEYTKEVEYYDTNDNETKTTDKFGRLKENWKENCNSKYFLYWDKDFTQPVLGAVGKNIKKAPDWLSQTTKVAEEPLDLDDWAEYSFTDEDGNKITLPNKDYPFASPANEGKATHINDSDWQNLDYKYPNVYNIESSSEGNKQRKYVANSKRKRMIITLPDPNKVAEGTGYSITKGGSGITEQYIAKNRKIEEGDSRVRDGKAEVGDAFYSSDTLINNGCDGSPLGTYDSPHMNPDADNGECRDGRNMDRVVEVRLATTDSDGNTITSLWGDEELNDETGLWGVYPKARTLYSLRQNISFIAKHGDLNADGTRQPGTWSLYKGTHDIEHWESRDWGEPRRVTLNEAYTKADKFFIKDKDLAGFETRPTADLWKTDGSTYGSFAPRTEHLKRCVGVSLVDNISGPTFFELKHPTAQSSDIYIKDNKEDYVVTYDHYYSQGSGYDRKPNWSLSKITDTSEKTFGKPYHNLNINHSFTFNSLYSGLESEYPLINRYRMDNHDFPNTWVVNVDEKSSEIFPRGYWRTDGQKSLGKWGKNYEITIDLVDQSHMTYGKAIRSWGKMSTTWHQIVNKQGFQGVDPGGNAASVRNPSYGKVHGYETLKPYLYYRKQLATKAYDLQQANDEGSIRDIFGDRIESVTKHDGALAGFKITIQRGGWVFNGQNAYSGGAVTSYDPSTLVAANTAIKDAARFLSQKGLWVTGGSPIINPGFLLSRNSYTQQDDHGNVWFKWKRESDPRNNDPGPREDSKKKLIGTITVLVPEQYFIDAYQGYGTGGHKAPPGAFAFDRLPNEKTLKGHPKPPENRTVLRQFVRMQAGPQSVLPKVENKTTGKGNWDFFGSHAKSAREGDRFFDHSYLKDASSYRKQSIDIGLKSGNKKVSYEFTNTVGNQHNLYFNEAFDTYTDITPWGSYVHRYGELNERSNYIGPVVPKTNLSEFKIAEHGYASGRNRFSAIQSVNRDQHYYKPHTKNTSYYDWYNETHPNKIVQSNELLVKPANSEGNLTSADDAYTKLITNKGVGCNTKNYYSTGFINYVTGGDAWQFNQALENTKVVENPKPFRDGLGPDTRDGRIWGGHLEQQQKLLDQHAYSTKFGKKVSWEGIKTVNGVTYSAGRLGAAKDIYEKDVKWVFKIDNSDIFDVNKELINPMEIEEQVVTKVLERDKLLEELAFKGTPVQKQIWRPIWEAYRVKPLDSLGAKWRWGEATVTETYSENEWLNDRLRQECRFYSLPYYLPARKVFIDTETNTIDRVLNCNSHICNSYDHYQYDKFIHAHRNVESQPIGINWPKKSNLTETAGDFPAIINTDKNVNLKQKNKVTIAVAAPGDLSNSILGKVQSGESDYNWTDAGAVFVFKGYEYEDTNVAQNTRGRNYINWMTYEDELEGEGLQESLERSAQGLSQIGDNVDALEGMFGDPVAELLSPYDIRSGSANNFFKNLGDRIDSGGIYKTYLTSGLIDKSGQPNSDWQNYRYELKQLYKPSVRNYGNAVNFGSGGVKVENNVILVGADRSHGELGGAWVYFRGSALLDQDLNSNNYHHYGKDWFGIESNPAKDGENDWLDSYKGDQYEENPKVYWSSYLKIRRFVNKYATALSDIWGNYDSQYPKKSKAPSTGYYDIHRKILRNFFAPVQVLLPSVETEKILYHRLNQDDGDQLKERTFYDAKRGENNYEISAAGNVDDYFGSSCAMHEDTIVIGAPYHNFDSLGRVGLPDESRISNPSIYSGYGIRDESTFDKSYIREYEQGRGQTWRSNGIGAAYVYEFNHNSFEFGFQQKLSPESADIVKHTITEATAARFSNQFKFNFYYDLFGSSLALNKDTLFVGAPFTTAQSGVSEYQHHGSVHIFHRNYGRRLQTTQVNQTIDKQCLFGVEDGVVTSGYGPEWSNNAAYDSIANGTELLSVGAQTSPDDPDGNGKASESYIRFSNLGVPPSAIIHSAYLKVTPNKNLSTHKADVYATIRGFDTANATVPEIGDGPGASTSALNTYKAIVRTSGYRDWNLTTVFADYNMKSPDISNVIQELVDTPGWDSGNAMALTLEPWHRIKEDPVNNPTYWKRTFYSADYAENSDGENAPALEISWSLPVQLWQQEGVILGTGVPSGQFPSSVNSVYFSNGALAVTDGAFVVGSPQMDYDEHHANYVDDAGLVVAYDYDPIKTVPLFIKGGSSANNNIDMYTKASQALAGKTSMSTQGHGFAHNWHSLYIGPLVNDNWISLHTKGHQLKEPFENPELYILGATTATDSLNLRTVNKANDSGNISLMLKNVEATGHIPLNVHGPSGINNNISLVLQQKEVHAGDPDLGQDPFFLYTRGRTSNSGSIPMHSVGHSQVTYEIYTYNKGHNRSSGTASLHTFGPIQATGNISMLVKGYGTVDNMGNLGSETLFSAGHINSSGSMSLMINPNPASGLITMFAQGPVPATGSMSLHTTKWNEASGQMNMSWRGVGNLNTEFNLSIHAPKTPSGLITLNTSGPFASSGNIGLFTKYTPGLANNSKNSETRTWTKNQVLRPSHPNTSTEGSSFTFGGSAASKYLSSLTSIQRSTRNRYAAAKIDHGEVNEGKNLFWQDVYTSNTNASNEFIHSGHNEHGFIGGDLEAAGSNTANDGNTLSAQIYGEVTFFDLIDNGWSYRLARGFRDKTNNIKYRNLYRGEDQLGSEQDGRVAKTQSTSSPYIGGVPENCIDIDGNTMVVTQPGTFEDTKSLLYIYTREESDDVENDWVLQEVIDIHGDGIAGQSVSIDATNGHIAIGAPFFSAHQVAGATASGRSEFSSAQALKGEFIEVKREIQSYDYATLQEASEDEEASEFTYGDVSDKPTTNEVTVATKHIANNGAVIFYKKNDSGKYEYLQTIEHEIEEVSSTNPSTVYQIVNQEGVRARGNLFGWSVDIKGDRAIAGEPYSYLQPHGAAWILTYENNRWLLKTRQATSFNSGASRLPSKGIPSLVYPDYKALPFQKQTDRWAYSMVGFGFKVKIAGDKYFVSSPMADLSYKRLPYIPQKTENITYESRGRYYTRIKKLPGQNRIHMPLSEGAVHIFDETLGFSQTLLPFNQSSTSQSDGKTPDTTITDYRTYLENHLGSSIRNNNQRSANGTHFGYSFDTDGEHLIVGAPKRKKPSINFTDVHNWEETGEAYVYKLNSSSYDLHRVLVPGEDSADGTMRKYQRLDNFGYSVCIGSGTDYWAVGSPNHSLRAGQNSLHELESRDNKGKIYTFLKDETVSALNIYVNSDPSYSSGEYDPYYTSAGTWYNNTSFNSFAIKPYAEIVRNNSYYAAGTHYRQSRQAWGFYEGENFGQSVKTFAGSGDGRVGIVATVNGVPASVWSRWYGNPEEEKNVDFISASSVDASGHFENFIEIYSPKCSFPLYIRAPEANTRIASLATMGQASGSGNIGLFTDANVPSSGVATLYTNAPVLSSGLMDVHLRDDGQGSMNLSIFNEGLTQTSNADLYLETTRKKSSVGWFYDHNSPDFGNNETPVFNVSVGKISRKYDNHLIYGESQEGTRNAFILNSVAADKVIGEAVRYADYYIAETNSFRKENYLATYRQVLKDWPVLERGRKYRFDQGHATNRAGNYHPAYISKYVDDKSSKSMVQRGVTYYLDGQAYYKFDDYQDNFEDAVERYIIFEVPYDQTCPDKLYLNCGIHSNMSIPLTVTDEAKNSFTSPITASDMSYSSSFSSDPNLTTLYRPISAGPSLYTRGYASSTTVGDKPSFDLPEPFEFPDIGEDRYPINQHRSLFLKGANQASVSSPFNLFMSEERGAGGFRKDGTAPSGNFDIYMWGTETSLLGGVEDNANLFIKASEISGVMTDNINFYMNSILSEDVTSNMNLYLDSDPVTGTVPLFLGNAQSGGVYSEGFDESVTVPIVHSGEFSLHLKTTEGNPSNTSFNLVMPLKGPYGGEEKFEKANLFLHNTSVTGVMSMFTRTAPEATGIVLLTIPSGYGIVNGISPLAIDGYDV